MILRPMIMADADKLLEWKNYPETREFAIVTKEEINREDHHNWLKDNIDQFQIIADNQELCGAIRINHTEISIWIDRKYRNKGVATFFLRQVIQPGMYAKIVSGNIGSMRAFIKAGLKPISYYNNSYYLFR